jgi:hypothetical protein
MYSLDRKMLGEIQPEPTLPSPRNLRSRAKDLNSMGFYRWRLFLWGFRPIHQQIAPKASCIDDEEPKNAPPDRLCHPHRFTLPAYEHATHYQR